MRIPKKYLIYSLFLIFFSFFFVNNSYAVDDYIINWTSSDPGSNYVFCDNTDVNKPNCSDYSYFIIDTPSGVSFEYSTFQFTNLSGSVVPARVLNGLVTTFTLRNNIRKIVVGSTGLSSMTLTLTDYIGIACPEPPSGSITLSSNGTYDVTSYAEAVVDVPATVIQGDYHDDLVRIYKAIMTCSAVVLVLYFFYCIYRMIIKSTGGKQ